MIEHRLNEAKIPFEFLISERYLHTWEVAKTLNIDDYSAILAVGGDGTLHEVVNGLM